MRSDEERRMILDKAYAEFVKWREGWIKEITETYEEEKEELFGERLHEIERAEEAE